MDDDQTAAVPSVGRSFTERLLLSIIDAYPSLEPSASDARKTVERNRRLDLAMEALFGERKASKGPVADPDLKALRWMGGEHVRDKSLVSIRKLQLDNPRFKDTKPRSDRALAKEAATKFYSTAGDTSERLRKKFSAERDYWMAVEMVHDDVAEVQETWRLAEIQRLLGNSGVKTLANRPDGSCCR